MDFSIRCECGHVTRFIQSTGGGGHLDTKMSCYMYRDSLVKYKTRDCLIFKMGILIHGKLVFILRRGPGKAKSDHILIPHHTNSIIFVCNTVLDLCYRHNIRDNIVWIDNYAHIQWRDEITHTCLNLKCGLTKLGELEKIYRPMQAPWNVNYYRILTITTIAHR